MAHPASHILPAQNDTHLTTPELPPAQLSVRQGLTVFARQCIPLAAELLQTSNFCQWGNSASDRKQPHHTQHLKCSYR